MSRKNEDIFAGVELDVSYQVKLRRPVRIGRTWLRPGANPVMKGKAVLEHRDDISELSPHAA
ncbi:MAG: hypothetical protein M9905_17470 [Rhizobiaceae bacterium]|nr:hypothetical protein [Rhizobiaceae bacterium]